MGHRRTLPNARQTSDEWPEADTSVRPPRALPVSDVCDLFTRDLLSDSFDVKVHAADLKVAKMVAVLACDGRVVLIDDWAFEGMQGPGVERGFGLHRQFFHLPPPQEARALFALLDESVEYSGKSLSFRGTRVNFIQPVHNLCVVRANLL